MDSKQPDGVHPNGAALAAFLAAGIGGFAMGLIVILSETGVFEAPVLYEPAGGVSGRTTLAVVVWLVAWAVLHARWKARDVAHRGVATAALLLLLSGIALCTPPLWGLFS
jgi:hypothetical protein